MSDVDDTVIVRNDPLDQLTLERSIELRWTLRDIFAGRTKFLPLADTDLELLIEMGLVEMHDDAPALTDTGLATIE